MITRRQAQGRTTHVQIKRPSLSGLVNGQLSNKGKSAIARTSALTKAKEKTIIPSPVQAKPRVSGNLSTKIANSTPKPSTSKPVNIETAKEVELLKKLNTELLRRVKALEDELLRTSQTQQAPSPITHSTQLLPGQSALPTTAPAVECPRNSTSTPAVNDTHLSHSPLAERPRLLIYGDSMIRDFGNILQSLLPEYRVQCASFPGASLSLVIKSLKDVSVSNLTKQDIVFIMAGTNNIPSLTPAYMEKEFLTISNICLNTNLVFSSVPFRYDVKGLNSNVFASNQYILNQSFKNNFHYFECNFFFIPFNVYQTRTTPKFTGKKDLL